LLGGLLEPLAVGGAPLFALGVGELGTSAIVPTAVVHTFDVDAELGRVFGDGVRPLHFEQALVDAMLAGWARQQQSRMLCPETIVNRRQLVGRLQAHTGAWPREWRAEHLEEWIEDLALAPRRLHVSTLRNYQIAIRLFCDYLLDRRYPWTAICAERLGVAPRQIVGERNLIVHTNEFEGDPSRRPLSRDELVAFFDFCDAQVAGRRALRRKGSLAALRDAALFKTIYAWGLRRQEAARLDVVDFARNPHKPDFGAFGSMSVRYGKAMAGGPPRRRNVLTVFDWAVEVIDQYVQEIRPLYGRDEHPALWLSERGAPGQLALHLRALRALPRPARPPARAHACRSAIAGCCAKPRRFG
jgi:integrase/recombinase XerC